METDKLHPDLVLKLRIDPATALRRKPDHDLDTIRVKCAITEASQYPGCETIELDAKLSLEEVITAAKQAVFAHLFKAEQS